ncbi:MAG TPA: protoporphyrinogen oxidase [Acidimicrobiales bacterium]|nr:protoporphyrinogen oxidase [Acidimicrobiales bacterium]
MKVAVIGGGIAGLAAAWELQERAEVTIFEPGRLGGKILTTDFCGHRVDEGPDAFITRTPEAVELCAELGLTGELVAPAAGRTLLWSGGRLRPLPEGLVLGVPRAMGPLLRSRLLSPLGLVRAGLDLVLPSSPSAGDVAVAELVGRRFGDQVTRRLVEPLVGGIHAARVDDLSAAATVPQLLAAANGTRSLLLGLRRQQAGAETGPAFLAPRGGVGRVVDRLVERLVGAGTWVRAQRAVRARILADGRVDVDGDGPFGGVVLATGATETSRILGDQAPIDLRDLESTSVVVVTLAFSGRDLPSPEGANGILVPPGEGKLMTACSFGSNKWPQWSGPGVTVLRVSAGRHGDDRAPGLGDADLVARLVDEVNDALGTHAGPVAMRVSRWPGSFPLYRVGHLERVERVQGDLARRAPNVVLAGASYGGAGIPACIASGRRAARSLSAAP